MFIGAGSWFKYPPQHMSEIVGIDLDITESPRGYRWIRYF